MTQDNLDRMVSLLEQIVQNTGGTNQGPTFPGIRVINPAGFVITETDDLDAANDDGTITLNPGDTTALAKFSASGESIGVLAVGATDTTDVEYGLRIDNQRVVGGMSNSPLGTITNPYSFVDAVGGIIPCETAEYIAHYDGDATGSIDLAARLFVEVP